MNLEMANNTIIDLDDEIAALKKKVMEIEDQRDIAIDNAERLHKALDSLLTHSIEFFNDWKKGDFELPKLAECDMESMACQFASAKVVLEETEFK